MLTININKRAKHNESLIRFKGQVIDIRLYQIRYAKNEKFISNITLIVVNVIVQYIHQLI